MSEKIKNSRIVPLDEDEIEKALNQIHYGEVVFVKAKDDWDLINVGHYMKGAMERVHCNVAFAPLYDSEQNLNFVGVEKKQCEDDRA